MARVCAVRWSALCHVRRAGAATGGAAAPGVWSRRKKESRLKQPIVHAAHGSVRAEWLQRTVSSRPSHRTTFLQVIYVL